MSKFFSTLKRGLPKTIYSDARIWIWISFATSLFGVFLFMTSEVREASFGETELIGTLDKSLLALAGTLRGPKLNEAALNITALGSGTVIAGVLLGMGWASALAALRIVYEIRKSSLRRE